MTIVLHSSRPRARKEHRCDECLRVIRPGESYDRYDLVHERTRYTSKTCAHCRAILALLLAIDESVDRHDGEDWPEVGEWLSEFGLHGLNYLRTHGWQLNDGSLIEIGGETWSRLAQTAADRVLANGAGR